MKILFFIRSLELGGAERQLLILADGLSERHDVLILTFYDGCGYDLHQMFGKKIKVVSLNKSGRWDTICFFWRFVKTVRQYKPELIYSFMSTASVFAVFAKLFYRPVSIVWGIRSSNVNLDVYGWVSKIFRSLECKLSRFADLVISNSDAGHKEALLDGFSSKDFLVVPNGIDTEKFQKFPDEGKNIRQALCIPLEANVIGVVGRHDPMKGLEVLLTAVALHLSDYPETYFIIIGSGTEEYTNSLKQMAECLGVNHRVTWVPKTTDVFRYYSAMDVFTSASRFGEGFSNVTGEAMSCELPCVITDVGDARLIVDQYGKIVPVDQDFALADSWKFFIDMPNHERESYGLGARKRIVEYYSISTLVSDTEHALQNVIESKLGIYKSKENTKS